jgi:inositol oxygenase
VNFTGLNHKYQTYEFVQNKRAEFLKFDKKGNAVWAAFDFLNQLVDDSDPDTDLDQFQHLLQTSEAIRRDGHPIGWYWSACLHEHG